MTSSTSLILEINIDPKADLMDKNERSPSLMTGSNSPSNKSSHGEFNSKDATKQNSLEPSAPKKRKRRDKRKKRMKKTKKDDEFLKIKRERSKEKKINVKEKKEKTKEINVLQSIKRYQNKVKRIYKKKEYNNDIALLKQDKGHQFMMENFPSMYNQVNLFTYYKNLNNKRHSQREIFIPKKEVQFYLSPQSLVEEPKTPTLRWSEPKSKLDYNEFWTKCNEVWPFKRCRFIKEFALEFLMNHSYNIDECVNNIDEFVSFMKMKTKENKIPLVDDQKIIKNYNLRGQKNF